MSWDKEVLTFAFRQLYTKSSFIIISDNFLKSLKRMIQNLELSRVVELACGTGWLSHWMKKYDIPIIDSIDNKSWERFEHYLPLVTKMDAVKYVKKNNTIELFILSWPYMDNLAKNIWKYMQSGQYLLYIGESCGGCTANDDFFEAISEDNYIEDRWNLWQSLISFSAIHDRPYLYLKK